MYVAEFTYTRVGKFPYKGLGKQERNVIWP